MNVEEILTELGYKLRKSGDYYSAPALYRNGDNPTALTIYPKQNLVIDWVSGQRFSLEGLVQVSLNLSDLNQAKDWLKNRNVTVNTEKPEPAINEIKTFPLEWLNELVPDHSYWIKRGIKKEVLDELRGGIATDKIPRMKGRYIFPILNSKNQLIGLNGRSLEDKLPKYKIIGQKNNFFFGFNINLTEILRKKEVIIVESVGDAISLSSSNIKTWLCLFGISLSNEQLTKLIQIAPQKIIIALNNDGKAGNEAAQKLQKRLNKFFDKQQIKIKLPRHKDLNDLIRDEGENGIRKWYEN